MLILKAKSTLSLKVKPKSKTILNLNYTWVKCRG